MSSGAALELVDAATANYPAIEKGMRDQSALEDHDHVDLEKHHGLVSEELRGPNGEEYPSQEDWATLRRVYGKVNWMIYVIGIIEMCER